ncbi:MAG TPA: hypothetical protein VIM55_12020 [Mucilaginibacter sp.]
MKNKIRYFLLAFLLFVNSFAFAQVNGSYYSKISDYIHRNYHPDSNALVKSCKGGCLFLKFHINLRGEVSDISFGGDTNSTAFIRKSLIFSLQLLKRDAGLINFLKQSGKTIIQPFIFDYRDACKISEPEVKTGSEYFNAQMDFLGDLNQSMFTSLFNMLKFDGKQLSFVDGVILDPIYDGNVKMN